MALVARRLATSTELFAIPEEQRFHEVIDGEIVQKASPTFEHGAAQAKLSESVGPFNRRPGGGRPGGWWIVSEVEIELEAHQVYRPDLSGWRRDHVPERPSGTPIRIRPDWVCEILSPRTRSYDQRTKKPFYARSGVQFIWYVDIQARTLTVSRLHEGRWLEIGTFIDDDVVRAEPFEAAEIRLVEFWPASPAEP